MIGCSKHAKHMQGMECLEGLNRKARRLCARAHCGIVARLRDSKGQGTTEYAILVGVLVVIAMLAITVFKPKIQQLWDAIANGINGL